MKLGWQATMTGDIPITPKTDTQETTDDGNAADPHRAATFDLYVPTNPWALVVYIHGGGWEAGDKDRPPGYRSLLSAGLAVASVSYRFSDEATIDDMVDDVLTAARAARATLASRGHRAIPWVLWGISAGGHLALLAAALSDEGETPVAICSWCGPTDLPALATLEGVAEHCRADITRIVGKLLDGSPQSRLHAWSPITHVRPGLPPHLLIHGSQDGLVPPDQSRRMHEQLVEAGVLSEYFEVPGGTHAMPPSHWAGTDRMVAFFQKAAPASDEERV